MKLSIVLPIYNEEDNILPLYDEIKSAISNAYEFEIIAVNEGSKDRSLEILSNLSASDKRVKTVDFRRNFGQTAAMAAGIDHSQRESGRVFVRPATAAAGHP